MKLILLVFLLTNICLCGANSTKTVCNITDQDEFKYYTNQKVAIKIPKNIMIGKNYIEFILEKPNLPSGYIVSAFLDIISFPKGKKPEIEYGYPKSSIQIFQFGNYELQAKVNLVYRSS